VREPENRVRFHWIGFHDSNADVMAAGALQSSDGKRGSATRYPCEAHAFTALGQCGVSIEASDGSDVWEYCCCMRCTRQIRRSVKRSHSPVPIEN
jgi:hypothetical protein